MIKRDKLGRFVKGSHSSTEIKKEQYKGEKNPMYGKTHTKEAREKIKQKCLGNKKWLGKKHKEESKKKLREFREGKTYEEIFGSKEKAEEVREKISLKSEGHILPKKSREKLSKKRIGDKNPFYGEKHSKATIKKMKRWRISFVLPVKDTSIEVKIQNFLKKLEIEFFTHEYMKIKHGYQCDILIPSMNIVIECDGNYWHKYPIGKELDHIRTKELIKKGFKVLRLWEFEINEMSIKEFEERLGGLK